MHRIPFFIALLLIAAGCAEAESGAKDYASSQELNDFSITIPPTNTAEPPPPPTPRKEATPAPQQNRKIIYTANARMQVDSLETALQTITEMTNNAGGFLSSQRIEDNTYRKTARLVLRLPVVGFSGKVNELLKIGNFIDNQSMNSQDVSAEWIDLESRLATKRAVRDRYVEILRKRANKVEDILAAEDKIRAITEEIEARESRLRFLRDQVNMSTFTLEIYQTQEVRTPPPTYVRHFGHEVIDSLSNGLSFVKYLLLGLLSVWPIFLLLPLGIWGWRRFRG